ncbi:MAG: A/G-specific adenine glycosylase [Planctomycetaceae bacterium]|nr:A/G-specific adenine glycosylase [Planctomycetaceae bacterium]
MSPSERFDSATLRRLRTRLKRWFRSRSRPLPWRETRDPYRIWISEVMLQQTTVAAVVPYFERFLDRFPTVQELAASSEEEVLRYWEGLGYYSRGRNLRLGAIAICEQHGGELPADVETLQQLPGIGRYTAGAIVSFAYDRAAPILEANTIRVYARLLGYDDDPLRAAGQRLLWELAALLPPKSGAGVINQSLMEVGSLVCRPQMPQCPDCPLQEFCRAFQLGLQEVIPPKKQRPQITQLVEGTIALRRRGKYLVRRRGPDERWAGMWDFPRFPLTSVDYNARLTAMSTRSVQEELFDSLHSNWGLTASQPGDLHQIRHSVTRYRIRLLCLHVVYDSGPVQHDDSQWATLQQLAELPLTRTSRQFAEHLAANGR